MSFKEAVEAGFSPVNVDFAEAEFAVSRTFSDSYCCTFDHFAQQFWASDSLSDGFYFSLSRTRDEVMRWLRGAPVACASTPHFEKHMRKRRKIADIDCNQEEVHYGGFPKRRVLGESCRHLSLKVSARDLTRFPARN